MSLGWVAAWISDVSGMGEYRTSVNNVNLLRNLFSVG